MIRFGYYKFFIVLSCFFLLWGCGRVKTPIPDFHFTEQQIQAARTEFRQSNNEILFFLMVDRDGKVVKSEVIDFDSKKLDRRDTEKFKRSTYRIEFKPALETEPDFREFIYPMNVNTSFEWR